MAARARDALAVTLKDLLYTGNHSDLIIVCGGDAYDVHRAIVCSRTAICSKACSYVAEVEPIDENTLRLLDSDQRAVKLMMDYLYEGEYEPKLPAGCASIFGTKPHFTGEMKDDYLYLFPHTCRKALCKTKVCPHHHCSKHRGNVCVHFVCRTCCPTWIPPIPTEPDQLLLHYRMFQIGKRYSVVGLSDLAREKFEQWCEKYWDDDYFLKVGDIVFSSTNKDEQSLKDVVAKTVSNHMCLLNKPTVQDWMQMANGLAVSLVNLRAQDLGWVKPDAAK